MPFTFDRIYKNVYNNKLYLFSLLYKKAKATSDVDAFQLLTTANILLKNLTTSFLKRKRRQLKPNNTMTYDHTPIKQTHHKSF